MIGTKKKLTKFFAGHFLGQGVAARDSGSKVLLAIRLQIRGEVIIFSGSNREFELSLSGLLSGQRSYIPPIKKARGVTPEK
jgi:hypothetical protein